jgi:hypothetical protein
MSDEQVNAPPPEGSPIDKAEKRDTSRATRMAGGESAETASGPAATVPPSMAEILRTAGRKTAIAVGSTALAMAVLGGVGCAMINPAPVNDWLGRLIGGRAAAYCWFILNFTINGAVIGAILGFPIALVTTLRDSARKR